MIQEGQPPASHCDELADGLRRIGAETFGDAPGGGEIAWIAIPTGFGFTAGEPSTSSLVVRSVPVGFPDDRREAFLAQHG
jgi:hypothetical protein